MSKSMYIPGILFVSLVLLCSYTGRADLSSGTERYPALSGSLGSRINWSGPALRNQKGHAAEAAISRVSKIYNAQVGIRETGYNAGLQVEAYLNYVRLPKGNPWCAAFVCWVFGQAGVENPKTGWSPSLFPVSKVIWTRGTTGSQSRQAGPADVFGLYFPEKKRIAHAGFIDEWDGTWVLTVEGNTNPSGSREGDGVYRKRRLVSTIYQVARYVPEERRAGS